MLRALLAIYIERERERGLIEMTTVLESGSDQSHYPYDPGSGDASRPVGVDLPVNHADPRDDSALKYYYFKFVLLTRQETNGKYQVDQ